jgi:hypothetical protein
VSGHFKYFWIVFSNILEFHLQDRLFIVPSDDEKFACFPSFLMVYKIYKNQIPQGGKKYGSLVETGHQSE